MEHLKKTPPNIKYQDLESPFRIPFQNVFSRRHRSAAGPAQRRATTSGGHREALHSALHHRGAALDDFGLPGHQRAGERAGRSGVGRWIRHTSFWLNKKERGGTGFYMTD